MTLAYPRNLTMGILLLLCATTLTTQNRKREIRGVVLSANTYEPIKDAIVQLKSDELLSIMSFYTNRKGAYTFHHIPDGEYILTATYKGHTSSLRRVSRLDRQDNRTINFVIDLR